MYLAVEDLVSPGGPSGPVWAFLSAISLGILGIIGQQLTSRRNVSSKLDEAKDKAGKAAKDAATAAKNTSSISNGFAGRMDSKLDSIIAEQDRQGDALRKHLEWHLSERKQ
jgi:hypothetical protein